MPKILLTNDDGVTAPGLLALKDALLPLGEVVILAPDRNWSAAGHTKTMHKPLRVEQVTLADGYPALTTNGAPSDCVALAVLGIVEGPIDLVVSGINAGVNLGYDITYSGTVAGAMEGVVNGIPAVAMSQEYIPDEPISFDVAARVAYRVVRQVLKHGLPPDTFLNVNVPAHPARIPPEFEITRLGRRVYRDVLIKRFDPRGRPYYWIGGDPPTGVPEPGTDIGALQEGKVSITPISMDMTHYAFLPELRSWSWDEDDAEV
ncbi:MAG: 5'/3'-nucleotidase SurE [Chloroflexi bacterium]|nr:5'/3'-nucleotidase SurE [Chloroflexota bacterium]